MCEVDFAKICLLTDIAGALRCRSSRCRSCPAIFFVYVFFAQKGLCTKKAEFRYYEFQKLRSNGIKTRRRVDGTFIEDIEMDVETGAFERINVPPILESRRSTVLHDFETVITCTISLALIIVHYRTASRYGKHVYCLYEKVSLKTYITL